MNGAPPGIQAAADAMWWRMCRSMQRSKAWPAVFEAGAARELSRAVLTELFEANDPMLRAGLKVSRSLDYQAADSIGGEIWRAMIKAALDELNQAEAGRIERDLTKMEAGE
jgi:hypothetical protein